MLFLSIEVEVSIDLGLVKLITWSVELLDPNGHLLGN